MEKMDGWMGAFHSAPPPTCPFCTLEFQSNRFELFFFFFLEQSKPKLKKTCRVVMSKYIKQNAQKMHFPLVLRICMFRGEVG